MDSGCVYPRSAEHMGCYAILEALMGGRTGGYTRIAHHHRDIGPRLCHHHPLTFSHQYQRRGQRGYVPLLSQFIHIFCGFSIDRGDTYIIPTSQVVCTTSSPGRWVPSSVHPWV